MKSLYSAKNTVVGILIELFYILLILSSAYLIGFILIKLFK